MSNGERANATHGYVESQDVKLREYFEILLHNLEKSLDARFNAQEKSLDARFAAQEKAIATALAATDKRFDSTNEWRKTVDDISKQNVGKSEFDALKDSIDGRFLQTAKDIKSLELTRAELSGKASQTQVIVAYIISIIGIVFGIINIITR